jgi:hypothetical protein
MPGAADPARNLLHRAFDDRRHTVHCALGDTAHIALRIQRHAERWRGTAHSPQRIHDAQRAPQCGAQRNNAAQKAQNNKIGYKVRRVFASARRSYAARGGIASDR